MSNPNTKNITPSLPHTVWTAEQLPRLEREAVHDLTLTGYELMQRAGEAVWRIASARYPQARHWLVLCGHGNNGGDGYVVARLARQQGKGVTLVACEGNRPLSEAAYRAMTGWLVCGGTIHPADTPWPENVEVIIDALLGTGLKRAPEEPIYSLIAQANQHPAPVVAVDIPSGLSAANGSVASIAINAALTVSFIALKPGLLTGQARDRVGELHHDALGLQQWLNAQQAPWQRLDCACLDQWLLPRRPTTHKGEQGKLLLIGGDRGMAGAIRMAAEAGLRAGAGLVRVLTHQDNIVPVLAGRPELMVDKLAPTTLENALQWADVVVIGPGLGQADWGRRALEQVATSQKPMLWDADALNLLAFNADKRQNRVLTPHAGEAARLLGCQISDVESDRLHAAQTLVQRYGGIVVLKGAGTLIVSQQGEQAIADTGNSGMASAGMGDVLSGIIGSFMAQGIPCFSAASAGCVVHGAAADSLARRHGTRGMLATDLFAELYPLINPGIAQES
ncbi:bifunctional ADP-dependent NAD(P)H-hydrate dehydratase/NAD(P)H-hydrate epimerase [Enterobacteriaceae bacterium LUAb1]